MDDTSGVKSYVKLPLFNGEDEKAPSVLDQVQGVCPSWEVYAGSQ
jgi:hypothetical protein